MVMLNQEVAYTFETHESVFQKMAIYGYFNVYFVFTIFIDFMIKCNTIDRYIINHTNRVVDPTPDI